MGICLSISFYGKIYNISNRLLTFHTTDSTDASCGKITQGVCLYFIFQILAVLSHDAEAKRFDLGFQAKFTIPDV